MAYWGQNSSGNQYPDNPEDDLVDVCQNREYDIVVIGFVVTFFDPNNKGMTSTYGYYTYKNRTRLECILLKGFPQGIMQAYFTTSYLLKANEYLSFKDYQYCTSDKYDAIFNES